jgi:branched-subunit amino acid aminotransferase/4-amino-4-deoxychorismate lyase
MPPLPNNAIRATSSAWLWTGTAFEPTESVPVTDRAFRYGMSVFESFPIRNGLALFLDAHLHRLTEACRITGLLRPQGSLESCPALLAQSPDGFARIYITAGDGPVTGDFDACRAIIFVEARDPIPSRVYHRGYDLATHPGAHVALFPGLKTGNYWANLLAFREGVAAHCNETLLFTPAGHLISACMANVFVVTGGRIRTPHPDTGARAGVVREWVMRQVDVEETLITRADLAGASDIFLTSSWLGIMPAASLDGCQLKQRTISSQLLEAWRKTANSQ